MPSHPPFDLDAAARQSMIEHGFEPDFPPRVALDLAALAAHPPKPDSSAQDLRDLLWSSIDNDTSRDLDQVEYAESLPDGSVRVLIGIADVDAYVPKGSAIDEHAATQTVTVYTGLRTFPMLPEEFSTGLTSLLEGEARECIVTEFQLSAWNSLTSSRIYPAIVKNKAQLAYNSVGAWLDAQAEAPPKIAASQELQKQLKLQAAISARLRKERYKQGALDLETIETHAVMQNESIHIEAQQKNAATELIEDFMIAANGVVARTLQQKQIPAIRRIVKTPKRWDRIVQLAAGMGETLPSEPDSKALNDFLSRRKTQDPEHFADLSLTIVKLMGPGEYVVERPGDPPRGHFGLAVEDYTHSTAPNRRYADLVTQRLLKAMIADKPSPYSNEELESIAANCTARSTAERKVEREMQKRIAAVAMRHRIGQSFHAIVTGVTDRGTFVRTLAPHVEGMLVHGQQGVDVGDKLNVELVRTDPAHGYIDFARI